MRSTTLESAESSSPSSEKEGHYPDIWSALEQASTGPQQYLDPQTAKRWYEKTRQAPRPQLYFEQVIVERMKRSKSTRELFDALTTALTKGGASKGFICLTPAQFWALSKNERHSYLEKGKEQLEKQRTLNERIAQLRGKTFEQFVQITHRRLGASSTKDIQELSQGLQFIPLDSQEIEKWEQFLQNAIASAQELHGTMMKQLLDAQIGERIISKRVVAERIQKFKDTTIDYKQKEQYVKNMLPERIKEWRRVKQSRDDLMRQPDVRKLTATVPRLDVFLDEDKFLELKFHERAALVENVEYALYTYGDPEPPEQKSKIPSLKETLEARDRLRHFVRFEAGTSVQHSYTAVMAMGYRQTKRFLQLMYNRVWVHERGYSNQLLDQKEGSSKGNKQKTEERIENGHEWRFEHNIIEGSTAQKEAIRDECKKPQVLHMGRDGQQAVVDKVRANCDNEQFGYWTTLVPKELSYAKHSDLVKNFHYQIKCDMKLLEQAGMAFTLSDEVPLTQAA